MGHITLIRHGQANSHAKSEEEYDRLSERGHLQTRLLGDWFKQYKVSFDRIYVGTLTRQQESAQNIGLTPDVVDPRLNEIAYYELSDAMVSYAPHIKRDSPSDFVTHFPATMQAWKDEKIEGAETYKAFTSRISALFDELAARDENIVCVTSGGVIAQMISHVMTYDIPQMTKTALPIWNSSVHHIEISKHGALVSQFNAIPHIDPTQTDLKTVY